jgi:homopolymeric O-antigen transport system permease protein
MSGPPLTVIRPQGGWLDPGLDELWRYRDLIWLLVRRDVVAQYNQTVLGPVWHLVQPFLMTVTFTVVFGRVAGLPTDGIPKPLFYLLGYVVWNYFARSLTQSAGTFAANAHLFGKVYFPRLAVPIAAVLSNTVVLLVQLAFVAVVVVIYRIAGARVGPTAWLAAAPVLVAVATSLGLGAGLVVAALSTRYRDLTHLTTQGIFLLMYASTVLVPLAAVPPAYRRLILANPLTPLLEGLRAGILGRGTVEWTHLLYSTTVAVSLLVLGVALFSRAQRTSMDTM